MVERIFCVLPSGRMFEMLRSEEVVRKYAEEFPTINYFIITHKGLD